MARTNFKFKKRKMKNMNEKIAQTLKILEECARKKQIIYYQELYEEIGLSREDPNDRNKGSYILGEVNLISIKQNKTMLSSLVTLKDANQPADGFFEFAIELKRLKPSTSESDKLDFWVKEMGNVFKAYCDKTIKKK